MYCQIFFVISVRGIGLLPTTAPSAASGCMGFMNAAFGTRFAPFFAAFFGAFLAAFFAPPFLAPFLALFFPPFFAAILSPGRWNGWGQSPRRCVDFPYENRPPSRAKGIIISVGRNRENAFSPMRIAVFHSDDDRRALDNSPVSPLNRACASLARDVGDRRFYLVNGSSRAIICPSSGSGGGSSSP